MSTDLTHFEDQLQGLCQHVGPTTARRVVEALRPQLEMAMAHRPSCVSHPDRLAVFQLDDIGICGECAKQARPLRGQPRPRRKPHVNTPAGQAGTMP